jgi:acetyl esterase/lipase
MASWLLLALGLLGAVFTLNALRPTRHVGLVAPSFFAGWLTAELALYHLLWQVSAAAVLVLLGALHAWPGDVGLVVAAASWLGLASVHANAAAAGRAMEEALREGLGADYRARIDPALAEGLDAPVPLDKLFMPLRFRDARVRVRRHIAYVAGAGRRRQLDVWRPRREVHGAPVLLQIHGGAWVIGDKGQQALPLMVHLAARGWVCVAANYRLSPRAKFPDHLVDCKLALKWVREHVAEYGGDPSFVVVTGGSAGGHLAALVALTANDPAYQPGFEDVDTSVAGCVPFYGIYDFTNRLGVRGRGDPLAGFLARLVMPAPIADAREAYEAASPMSHVRADAPPFLVVHGARDNLAPVEEARRFAALLREASREPVVYAELPGAHHAFEVFYSVRAIHVVRGVERFLAWLASRRPRAAVAEEGEAAAQRSESPLETGLRIDVER